MEHLQKYPSIQLFIAFTCQWLTGRQWCIISRAIIHLTSNVVAILISAIGIHLAMLLLELESLHLILQLMPKIKPSIFLGRIYWLMVIMLMVIKINATLVLFKVMTRIGLLDLLVCKTIILSMIYKKEKIILLLHQNGIDQWA